MSGTAAYRGSRERRALLLLFAVLSSFYAVLFASVFPHYAYGEPGGFPVFYTTGKLARYDLHGIYSQHLQNIFHPLNDGVGYFFHLPYEAILLIPLSFLPQVVAFGVWSLINLVCLLGAALVLRRHFPSSQLLVPFAFAPTLSLLLNGQDVGIVVLLIALSFDRFASGKDLEPGAILALGLFKFPLIVPLVAILALRFWRIFVGFLVVAVPLLALSAAAVGRQGILDYLALTHGTDAKETLAILTNLRGLVGVLFGPHTALVLVLSIVLVVAAALMKLNRASTFAVAAIVTLLVSWHTHLYDALILLIPMAWMTENPNPWIRHAPTALVIITIPLLLNPAYGYLLAIAACILLMVLLIPRTSRLTLLGLGADEAHQGL